MGIVRVNQLPEGSGSLSSDDIFLFMDNPLGSGITKKISLSEIGNAIGGGGGGNPFDQNLNTFNSVNFYSTTFGGENSSSSSSYLSIGITSGSGIVGIVFNDGTIQTTAAATIGNSPYINDTPFGSIVTNPNNNNNVSSDYGTVLGGHGAVASLYGEDARSNGVFNSPGDAQVRRFILRGRSTPSLNSFMSLDGSDDILEIEPNTSWTYTINVVARSVDGKSASYRFEGLFERGINNEAHLFCLASHKVTNQILNWDCYLSSANYSLIINIESPGDDTYWVASAEIVQVQTGGGSSSSSSSSSGGGGSSSSSGGGGSSSSSDGGGGGDSSSSNGDSSSSSS